MDTGGLVHAYATEGAALAFVRDVIFIGGRDQAARFALEVRDELGQTRDRERLPDSAFAFPGQRKEPLTDAAHVKTALARFDQVQDVSDADRDDRVSGTLEKLAA